MASREVAEEFEIWGLRGEISGHLGRVDWITQAALGAALGELMLGKRLGNWALAWGALLGISPDLEVVLRPLFDTARQIAFHRGPSHSLVGIAVGSYALAQAFNRVQIKLRQKPTFSKLQVGSWIAAGWSAHVLVDCFTVEGAALLWPFAEKRVAFNLLDPLDVLFSAPLVITVLCLPFLRDLKEKKLRGKKPVKTSKRRRMCYWGLGLSSGYALFSVGMKFIASAGFDADLSRRGVKYQRRMESPTPFNVLLWRAVVDRGDELWVGYRTVFEWRQTPVRWTVYLKGKEALTAAAERRETQTLINFTDGWWIARPNAKGAWLGDLRFPESRVWGNKKGMVDSRLPVAWTLNFTATGDPLQPILIEDDPHHDQWSRMAARLVGDRRAWEANPRLAGVSGSLPEFLPVEE